MKLPKTANTKKIMILFVTLVFILQPAFALAQVLDSVEEPVVTTEVSSEDGSGQAASTGSGQGDIVIETGDVEVEVNLDNEVNQNTLGSDEEFPEEPVVIETPPEDTSTEPEEVTDTTASDPEEIIPSSDEDEASSPDELLDIDSEAEETSSVDDKLTNDNEFEGTNIVDAEGVSGENVSGETEGEVVVDTGDIKITAGLENDINNNDLDIMCVDCEDGDASSSIFDIENQNDGNLDNELGINATSGDNLIDESGDACIGTGNIGIVSMIINFVNTNFVGSGQEFFINIFNKMTGSIDLSGYDGDTVPENSFDPCDGPECQMNIDNNSTSTINNLIDIDVTTGSNVVATTTGGGIIETGDIDIVNDIINIANLNVSGNDYFFAVVNIFGEMDGDVILPAAKPSGEEGEFATSAAEKIIESELSSEFVISNHNDAGLSNDLNINANTGDNEMDGDGDSFIMTGDIESQIKTLNLINYNISGDSWKFARINVFGSWEGIINGLPEEYSYYEDADGITVYNKFLDDPALNEAYAQLAIDNYNIASTTNEINIEVSTGDNSILHHAEPSLIKTGYIKIKNSLLNFLNSNFSGNNWEFSMINVFGDWKGNLDFGQPELWINVSASEKETAEEGDYVTYTFIYGNNGDSTATNVIVLDDYNEGALQVAEAAGGEEGDGFVSWTLGDIPPNSQGSFSYTTHVRDIPAGKHMVENESVISSRESDRDTSNNSSFASFFVDGGASSSGISAVSSSKSSLPSLSIVKTNSASDIVYPGDIIDFELLIQNNGSRDALEVYVLDVMSNLDTGVEIHRDFWDLGTVFAGEEILIEYSLEVKADIESGTYINEATIEGFDTNRGLYISAIGSSRNKIVNDIVPEEIVGPSVIMSRVSRSSYVNPGDLVDFEIILANNGRGEALGIEVVEILPDHLTYSDTGDNVGSWNFDVIGPGEIKNIEYSIAVSDKAKEGFYESQLSLVGDNIGNGFLTNSIEVREIKVMGISREIMPPTENESEDDKKGVVFARTSEPVDPFIGLGGGERIIPEEPVVAGIELNQVFQEDSSVVSSTSFLYKVYLFIVFLTVLLVLIMFLFFVEGRDDEEKLV
ncbi:MAG: hypothetical protein PF572_05520 [Patescibacteria group bacterium]|jgi:uncharacterized repeat protein (TIGR01451 family)|nr:hypothetical protein [Patescibacteria group bacterium]